MYACKHHGGQCTDQIAVMAVASQVVGLSDFIIYDADVQLRNQLNEKYNDEVKRAWNIMKDYI